MIETISRSVVEKSRVKSFTFRCEWKDENGESDGYTYAIHKHELLKEITRRSRATGGRSSEPKIVPVDIGLYTLLNTRKDRLYSTVLEKHPLDCEVPRF